MSKSWGFILIVKREVMLFTKIFRGVVLIHSEKDIKQDALMGMIQDINADKETFSDYYKNKAIALSSP